MLEDICTGGGILELKNQRHSRITVSYLHPEIQLFLQQCLASVLWFLTMIDSYTTGIVITIFYYSNKKVTTTSLKLLGH